MGFFMGVYDLEDEYSLLVREYLGGVCTGVERGMGVNGGLR